MNARGVFVADVIRTLAMTLRRVTLCAVEVFCYCTT